jgi:hypothetical protein
MPGRPTLGPPYRNRVERISERDSLLPSEGTKVEAAARKSTETQTSRKATAAGTKRAERARSMRTIKQ